MKKKLVHTKDFMNTKIEIQVIKDGQNTVKLQESIEDAFGEFDRIVNKYTRFNESSELSNLNRNNGKWTKISYEFFTLIEFMLDLSKKTNGAFDPTIIDFLEMYGYDKHYNFEKLHDSKLAERIKQFAEERPHWSEIEINKKEQKVKLQKSQRIDLGAVGKGYAIDCAYEKIKNFSDNFIINAGGDIRASGTDENGENWKVSLQVPEDTSNIKSLPKKNIFKKDIGEIVLENNAIASSGSWARKVSYFHHLINPNTGTPVETQHSTVFVNAPTALEADAWATALFVGGEKIIQQTDFKYLLV